MLTQRCSCHTFKKQSGCGGFWQSCTTGASCSQPVPRNTQSSTTAAQARQLWETAVLPSRRLPCHRLHYGGLGGAVARRVETRRRRRRRGRHCRCRGLSGLRDKDTSGQRNRLSPSSAVGPFLDLRRAHATAANLDVCVPFSELKSLFSAVAATCLHAVYRSHHAL